jgi:hypothetical protein
MTSDDDIIAFIRARLDEDESVARATTGGGMPWRAQARSELHTAPAGEVGRNNDPDWSAHWVQIAVQGGGPTHGDRRGFGSRPDFRHIARHDPARVLRQADALRDVLTELEQLAERAPHPDTRMWAAGAIGRMALIWGTTEEVEALGG